jgi:dethiobiotin synthetase
MRVVFITGTDTNAGKTGVTGLLAAHLGSRQEYFRAFKPFCSGERSDARLLHALQEGRMLLEEINPFFFPEPLAPWTAARKAGQTISLRQTLDLFQAKSRGWLVIEGAGGLLTPLGESFSAADLITEMRAEVILAAPNRLGVLNHTLLSVEALKRRDVKMMRIALVDVNASDAACATNEADLRSLCPDVGIHRIPYFANYAPTAAFFRVAATEISAILANLLQ